VLNSIYRCKGERLVKRRSISAMSISSESSLSYTINKVTSNSWTDRFKVNAPQFLALAQKNDVIQLKESLCEIDISKALHVLTPESYLQVTLPVVGFTDFLASDFKNSIWDQLTQAFPSVLAINGWGGGDFPRPDFIMVTDIIGNRYEILVASDGQVEVPQEGLGLFSMLSEITLMYSYDQIIEGRGLQSLEEQGAKKNKLFFIPPPNLALPFTITIQSTHLNEKNSTEIDFEQKHLFIVNSDAPEAELTEFGARILLRNLFSEFDFLRCLLSENRDSDFFIAHVNHFNDFKISPEAVSRYHHGLLQAVIHQQLPSDFILSKVPLERIKSLNLDYAPLDEQDKKSIQRLGAQALAGLMYGVPRRPNKIQIVSSPLPPTLRETKNQVNSKPLR